MANKIDPAAAIAKLAVSPDDEAAWRDLYLVAWPYVLTVMYRLLRGARELAEDASQEVFRRLARTSPFGELLDPDDFRAYLWTLCRNVSRNYMRKLGLRKISLAHLRENLPKSSVDDPHYEMEAKELLDLLASRLEHGDREILRLLFEGYSLRDIVESTGLTYANTAVRIHRMRKGLNEFLQEKPE